MLHYIIIQIITHNSKLNILICYIAYYITHRIDLEFIILTYNMDQAIRCKIYKAIISSEIVNNVNFVNHHSIYFYYRNIRSVLLVYRLRYK